MGSRRDYDTAEIELPTFLDDDEGADGATGVEDASGLLDRLAAERADRWTLTVVNGARAGFVTALAEGATVLGRGRQVHLVLDDKGLSRRHACFVRESDSLAVRDLGSTNGTFVGRQRVLAERPLADGDTVRLANTLIRIQLRSAAELDAMQTLYESSVRDPLTKLFNRRHLDEALDSELSYALRHRTPLSVLLIDLDHFKRINDTYGHLAGDDVLRAAARFLEHLVRREDIVARYGGEELVVVARGIHAEGARVLGERIRGGIASMQIMFEGAAISLTASVGVATWTPERSYAAVDDLIGAADDCLYRAKAAGRDRVICDGSEPG